MTSRALIAPSLAAEGNDPESWRPNPRSRGVIQSFIRLEVSEGETLPDRLRAAGLDPQQASALILTHQHIDHTGTVPAFAGVDIWTTRAEDGAAGRIGALHWRWRDGGTVIRYVDDVSKPGGALEAIGTPGHTPGSVSVRLRTDQTDVVVYRRHLF